MSARHPTLLELDRGAMKLDDAPGKDDPVKPLTTVVGSRREEQGKIDTYHRALGISTSFTDAVTEEEAEAHRRLVDAPDHDPVNHPSHYTHYQGLEIIDLTEQMNFNKGNAVKYIARAGLKNPDTEIEDLEKARWYVDREIDRIKNRP